MPDLTSINALTGAILALFAIVSAIAGWLKVIRPRWRNVRSDVTAGRDALLGRPAVIDSITKEVISAELPGIGQRMSTQENATELLAVSVTKLVAHQEQQEKLGRRMDDVESRVAALEEATVERVVTKAESAAAWRAMEAVALAQPDVTIEPEPGE